MLCDETRIGGNEWRTLKQWAMSDDYQHQDWYGPLSDNEKYMVEALRQAQAAQGDMMELEPQPIGMDMQNDVEDIVDPMQLQQQQEGEF